MRWPSVAQGRAQFGVLVCTTGVGMSIAANKMPGIRAALADDEETAALARRHNNANVLCLAGKSTPPEQAARMLEHFSDRPLRRRPPRTSSQ